MLVKVVAAVLMNNDIIFLPRRAKTLKSKPGLLEFPGGKVELGESNVIALARELKEELSIKVNPNDIEDFEGNYLTTDKIELSAYFVKKWEGDLTLNSQINSDIISMNINNLYEIDDLLETDKKFIPSILNHLKKDNLKFQKN